ncbi:hypothetical protein DES47_101508 [Roseateles toxinivorans]|uniref:Uncharacterized protein n=1 Tax=Roseateles toxinivorans TaxID=270368 RepID=A0A4R6QU47_9BURK|nr:hypothetical protein DES47_101508 [Roseateles toxinivorans]
MRHDFVQSYRQTYRPAPAVHLPAWLRSLWRWL